MRQQDLIEIGQSADLPSFERGLVRLAGELDFPLVCGTLVVDPPGLDPLFVAFGNVPNDFADSFADPADYDKVRIDDRVTIEGVAEIPAGKAPTLVLAHADGTTERVALKTTISPDQFRWFVAGSALNLIRQRAQG